MTTPYEQFVANNGGGPAFKEPNPLPPSGRTQPVPHIVVELNVEDDIAIEPVRAVGPFPSVEAAQAWVDRQPKHAGIVCAEPYEIVGLEAPEPG